MSFGFGVGDLIAVFQLANKIRERFINAPEQFKAISNEVTGISNVLRDIEGVLSEQGLADWQKKALVPVLEECHNVLIALGKVVDQNYVLEPSNALSFRDKSRKVWKRLTWDDIQELRSRVTLNVSLLNAFNGSLISKVTLATKYGVDQLRECQDNQEGRKERKMILNWLTPIDYASQQSDVTSRQQAGTGQWLLDSAEYQAWLKADRQTLFCPGIPGAGKTILTSIVVNDLYNRFHNDSTVGIAYVYCNFQRKDEQKIDDLLASLLKQLAESQSSLPDGIKALYDHHKEKRMRPSLDEILRVLQSVVALYSRVFIIVDALDECQVSSGYRMRFLSEIFNLQAKCQASLFATSRFIPEISERFKESIRLEIRASQQDVQRYLDGHISQLPRCVLHSSELQDEIKAEIIKAVDGMFLLAKLHLDSLKGKKSPKAIRCALKKLPTGSDAYDYAYKDAMNRIEGQLPGEKELANQVLSWITFAKRPLTTSELEHALAIEAEEPYLDEENLCQVEDMVSVCAGLVTIDKESNVIRLVHYTTQEYFKRTQKQWFPNAETNITISCVTYLSFSVFEDGFCQTDEEFEERLRSNLLYDYTARNWGHHAHKLSTSCPDIIKFLEKKPQVEASSQALIAVKRYSGHSNYSQQLPRHMTGVHFAAYFGLDYALNDLLSQHSLDVVDSHGRTPLSYAAEKGHEAVVQLLLEKGAEMESKDKYGQTPLSKAAQSGHEVVVQLLLEKGAELESKNNYGHTPLLRPARMGHEALVQLLLEKVAELESKNKYGQAPLSKAVVQLLVEKAADDMTVTSDGGWAPLLLASNNEHIDVVKLLLEKVAELESKDKIGHTPLLRAARMGHEAVVKLLLEKGAAMTVTSDGGWTPLLLASNNGHIDVVKLLLEKGADMTVTSDGGWTPLLLASNKGHITVVKLLLEKGADVTVTSDDGWMPLLLASDNGYVDVVKLLLEKGAEADWRHPKCGRTALSYAAGNGLEAVIKLLLAKGGINWTQKDTIGRGPLSYAAQNGHDMVVTMLLTNECVDLDPKDHYGATPLSIAARNCRTEVVKLLLATGCVDFNARDCFGRTPLCWARRTGNADIAQLLLDCAETRGMSMYGSDAPIEVSLTPNDKASGWCDVCTLRVLKDDTYYNCGVCNGGDFDICSECYKIGARCLEVGHKLIQRKDNPFS